MRKIICIILCISMLTALSAPASAASAGNLQEDNIVFTDHVVETQLTASDISAYDIYNVNIPQNNLSGAQTFSDFITTSCVLISTEVVGGHTLKSYSSADDLLDYIPNCRTITAVSSIDNAVYVEYVALDNRMVTLCFGEHGLLHKTIYDSETDTAFYLDDVSGVRYENFRAGCSYEISDTYETEINTLVKKEDWESLSAMDDLSVSFSGDAVFIEPLATTRASIEGFTNESQLRYHLTVDSPPYTGTIKLTTYKDCPALSKSVTIRVTEDRDTYTKKTASFQSFAAGTAVSLIAYFLDVPSLIAVRVLTFVGIAISLTQTILDAVTLYNSAIYTYSGARRGYVYDTTVYNKFVCCTVVAGTGEFAGGYNAEGVFDWIQLSVSNAYSHEETELADTAFYNYNADIVVNGYCATYFPD